jgi:hypothetical protein
MEDDVQEAEHVRRQEMVMRREIQESRDGYITSCLLEYMGLAAVHAFLRTHTRASRLIGLVPLYSRRAAAWAPPSPSGGPGPAVAAPSPLWRGESFRLDD